MSRILYCHQVNKTGLVCAQKRHDGVCMAGGGIFGRCKWQEDYPPMPQPPFKPPASKVTDINKECSKDYLKGFRDGVLSVSGCNAEPNKYGKWVDCGEFEQCSACKSTKLKEITLKIIPFVASSVIFPFTNLVVLYIKLILLSMAYICII